MQSSDCIKNSLTGILHLCKGIFLMLSSFACIICHLWNLDIYMLPPNPIINTLLVVQSGVSQSISYSNVSNMQ